MNFFKKMFEAPKQRAPNSDEYERGADNIRKIRSIKKEYGHTHAVTLLNEINNKNQSIGEYYLDEKAVELQSLTEKLEKLKDNEKIITYLQETSKIIDVQHEIKKLKEYLEKVLTQDSP